MKTASLSIFAIVLILSLTASYSLVYTNIQSFSFSNLGGNSDAVYYLALYRGETVDRADARFRIVIPFLAKLIPDPPNNLFDRNRVIDYLWLVKIKFGIVNFIILTATGILFFYFLNTIGLSVMESIIGVLFFYIARPVVQSAGVPTVIIGSYFFLLVSLYALVRQNMILLISSFCVGMFVKESTLLVLPALLLFPNKYKIKALSFLILASIPYFVCRFFLYPVSQENYLHLIYLINMGTRISELMRLNKILDLFSSFGFLWILAIYSLGLPDTPILLKRWYWLILIIFAAVLLENNIGYNLFYGFPVIIPLSVYGMHNILRTALK